MKQWQPEEDTALLIVVEDNPEMTWEERAALLSTRLHEPITEDMIRNRYGRLDEQMKLSKVARDPVNHDIHVPRNPTGVDVGFKIAFFDLETTSLGAWTGDLLCASVVDNYGNLQNADRFQFEQSSPIDDKGLAVWIRETLEQFDILVAWNGTNFDLGFLNAKLTFHGELPIRRMLFLDPMYKARGGRYGMRIGSSKLKNVAMYFNTDHQKPDVAPVVWRHANYGDKDAMHELQIRCDADCYVMRDIFPYVKPYITTIHQ